LEWTVLVAFSFEYVLRAWVCTRNPRYAGAAERLRYLISFFALVDLLADLPSYIAAGGLDLASWRPMSNPGHSAVSHGRCGGPSRP
jgi:voltage-gated potassium channel